MASLTYDDMLERKVVFGTPAAVVDRLRALRDQLGLDGVVVELNPGGRIAADLETRSLRLLTQEVMPALRGGS
jgi:alkanesulfonate monooxygenase SsuD/methylene tetrahydromethanopterin reductase-like flavin-dependent oxidoreductase (luciferase family)